MIATKESLQSRQVYAVQKILNTPFYQMSIIQGLEILKEYDRRLVKFTLTNQEKKLQMFLAIKNRWEEVQGAELEYKKPENFMITIPELKFRFLK